MLWLVFLLSLLLIIVFHECGHFWVARLFHVAVERFSIGFGRPIFKWISPKYGTEFVLSPILLGGYVHFSQKNVLHQRQFETLARWKKILILLAGPVANILLAFMLMTIVFKLDVYEPIAIVGKLQRNSFLLQKGIKEGSRVLRCNDIPVSSWSDVLEHWQTQHQNTLVFKVNGYDKTMHVVIPAMLSQEDMFQKLGFLPYIHPLPAIVGGFTDDAKIRLQGLAIGDEILEVNHESVNSLQEISAFLKMHPDEQIQVKVKRQKKILNLNLSIAHQIEGSKRVGFMGIRALPFSEFPQWFVKKHYSWLDASIQSAKWMKKIIHWQLVTFSQGVEVSGPIGMVRAAQDAWALSLKAYLLFLVWLNIGIGFLNLLPIPILDGGQCLLLIIGKWFPAIEKEKNKKMILILSLFILFGLLMVGTLNDWSR